MLPSVSVQAQGYQPPFCVETDMMIFNVRSTTMGNDMKLRTWLILSLIILLTACAPTMQQPKELSIPSQRSIHTGFSLLPLNEEGWFVIAQEPRSLKLGKRSKDPDESIFLNAYTVVLPEFNSREEFTGFAKTLNRDFDPIRFEEITQETKTVVVKGQSCEIIKLMEKDNGRERVTNRTDPMIIEAYSLVCPHPQRKLGVVVSYAHRCYPGQADPEMVRKAEEIFKTVEFQNL